MFIKQKLKKLFFQKPILKPETTRQAPTSGTKKHTYKKVSSISRLYYQSGNNKKELCAFDWSNWKIQILF